MIKSIVKERNQKIALLIVAILLVILNFVNISLAYFTDSAGSDTSAVIVFGKININADIIEKTNSSFLITSQEMMPGNYKIYRTLKITCPSDSESFYARLKMVFKIGTAESNLVTMAIAQTSSNTYWSSYTNIASYDIDYWTLNNGSGKDNKYYFNNVFSHTVSQNTDYYIPLQFSVSQQIGEYVINNQICTLQIQIDVIQQANNGYSGWSNLPPSWPSV